MAISPVIISPPNNMYYFGMIWLLLARENNKNLKILIYITNMYNEFK